MMGSQEKITMPRNEMSGTQCLRRSFAIVRMLAGGDQEGEKLVEIAAALNLPHPTAHRILKALEEEGMVERVEGSQRYRLSSEAAWLGVGPFNRCPITRIAARHLDDLAQRTGEAVVLSVPSHTDQVFADRRAGKRAVLLRHAAIGARRPLGVGAGGQVMLAFMGATRIDSVLRDNAGRYGEWGLDAGTVRRQVELARSQGHLLGDSPITREARVLAVPVRDVVGRAIGAISLVGPRGPMFEHRASISLPLLRAAAQSIVDALHQQRLSA
jgi:DNA-binding IclR family transcriptional regulator